MKVKEVYRKAVERGEVNKEIILLYVKTGDSGTAYVGGDVADVKRAYKGITEALFRSACKDMGKEELEKLVNDLRFSVLQGTVPVMSEYANKT